MGIPNPESARYSSLQEFMGFFKKEPNHPSFTNLFSVHFSTPLMLRRGGGNVSTDRFTAETQTLSLLLDYYAKSVNLPSKQITTGQITNVGSGYRFATGSSFSQISINFQIPRSQYTRNFFERWTSLMANDANQYTDFYEDYVSPQLIIYKWERGGGGLAVSDPKLLKAVRDNGNNALLARKYKLTSAWVLQNVFPYNIGSIQLDNDKAKVMDLNVQFYYERYRFYTEDQFDDPGVKRTISLPGGYDNITTADSARNTLIRINEFLSVDPFAEDFDIGDYSGYFPEEGDLS